MDVDKNLRIMAIKMTLSTILQLYHSDSSIEHLLYIIDLKDLLLFFPERQLRLIEEWKREDIVFYDRTRAFEAAWNMVNSNTYITLIGTRHLEKAPLLTILL